MKKTLLSILIALGWAGALAQIPQPQINLTGNIGCQGFPCLNNGTLQFTSDANHTMTVQESSAVGGIKITSTVSLTATRNLILPTAYGRLGFIAVENATTGGQAIQVIGQSGTGYTIPNGTTATVWFDGTNVVGVTGGGISGLTSGYIPLAGSATTLTANSHLDDGVTTASTITSSEPIQVGTVTTGVSIGALGSPTNWNFDTTDASTALSSILSLTTTGSSGAATLSGTTLNIPNYAGGGGSVNVNGSSVSNPNFNGTTPAAPSNTINAAYGVSGSNVSTNVPYATGASFGVVKPDGTTVTISGGVISSTSGVSARIKYVSQLGCAAQNTDLTVGGGTDDTACINTALAAASPTNPVVIWQDGQSLISGTGIQGPAGGNWAIVGDGGGVEQTTITACGISGSTATFTTNPNTLVAGQHMVLEQLNNCSALNDKAITVLSSGLSSAGFQATVSASPVSSAAETGRGLTVVGSGFFYASSSNADAISNGITTCTDYNTTPPSRGANILFKDFVLNANRQGNGSGCEGIDIQNINHLTFTGLTVFNSAHYNVRVDNVGDVVYDHVASLSSELGVGSPLNTDGFHVDGPSENIRVANSLFQNGDDSIALNANEGYCGPIQAVEITNSVADQSFDFIRLDGYPVTCSGNGLPATVSQVNISNFGGTVYGQIGEIGAGGYTGSTSGVDDVTWSNSSIQFPRPLWLQTNLGNISFSHMMLRPIGTVGLLTTQSGGPWPIQSLHLHDLTILATPSGNMTDGLVNSSGALDSIQIGTVIVSGVGDYLENGAGTAIVCLLCLPSPASTSSISNVYYSDIDPANIYSVAGSQLGGAIHHIGGLWNDTSGNATLPGALSIGGALTGLKATLTDTADNSPLNISSTSTANTSMVFTNTTNTSCWVPGIDGSSITAGSNAGFNYYTCDLGGKTPVSFQTHEMRVNALTEFSWSSDNNFANHAAPDTGLSRDAADVVDCGNGAQGDKSCTFNAATYGAGALANGMTATTQSPGDSTTKVATDAFVAAAVSSAVVVTPHYWNIQPLLFSTSTLLGPVYFANYGNGSTYMTFITRQSGTISCTVAPTIQLMDLGTSASTAYGSATVAFSQTTSTSDGITSTFSMTAPVVAGHYYGIAFSAGTCTTAPTFDITVNW